MQPTASFLYLAVREGGFSYGIPQETHTSLRTVKLFLMVNLLTLSNLVYNNYDKVNKSYRDVYTGGNEVATHSVRTSAASH